MATKIQNFIKKIAPHAQQSMRESGVLASLIIAQAALESGWGESGLTVNANNLFGMKGEYKGKSYTCSTKEWVNGRYITIRAAFKSYPSWLESLQDHTGLFVRASRYHNLLGVTDYKLACKLVHEDGYATAPDYADKLIKLIEDYKLMEYDSIEMQKEPQFYEFCSGPITTGDLDIFVQMAKEKELENKSVDELTMYVFRSGAITEGDKKELESRAAELELRNAYTVEVER